MEYIVHRAMQSVYVNRTCSVCCVCVCASRLLWLLSIGQQSHKIYFEKRRAGDVAKSDRKERQCAGKKA